MVRYADLTPKGRQLADRIINALGENLLLPAKRLDSGIAVLYIQKREEGKDTETAYREISEEVGASEGAVRQLMTDFNRRTSKEFFNRTVSHDY